MSKTLNFTVEHQEHQQWCWAAVSVSVARFYEGSSNALTQCSIVNSQLPGNDCCAHGGILACNKPGFLDKALDTVKHFRGMISGSLKSPCMIQEIDDGRPIGARIGFPTRGHFVAIVGYDNKDPEDVHLIVSDPTWGESTGPLQEFSSAYLGSGLWTDTYLTQR